MLKHDHGCKSPFIEAVYSSYCGLPDMPTHIHRVNPLPEPCEQEECPVVPLHVEPIEHCKPTPVIKPFTVVPKLKGCEWDEERIQSIPPPVPCPNINVGWGQYDGGMNYWGGEIDPKVRNWYSEVRPEFYRSGSHEHLLDMDTSNRHHGFLAVIRDGFVHPMEIHEMMGLAVQLYRLAENAGVVKPVMPTKLGMALAQTGVNADNVPTYGLTVTSDGKPTGEILPLQAHWDATGEPVALTFQANMLPNIADTLAAPK